MLVHRDMIIRNSTMVSSEDSSQTQEDQEMIICQENALFSPKEEVVGEDSAACGDVDASAETSLLEGRQMYRYSDELAVQTTALTHLDGDIREKAYKLCSEYLRGAWKKINEEELDLRRVGGGLTNLLYYCALPTTQPVAPGEPTQVLIRLYGQIHGEKALDGLVTESVIFTMLSEKQRGPRLLGVFPGGRIEEYIPARPLKTSELKDPTLSRRVAQKLAQIHVMDVPINKEPKWLWDTMDRWLENVQEFTRENHCDPEAKARAKKLMNYSLQLELDWLKEYLVSVNSPVVFCHNDLQEGNILLRLDGQGNKGSQPELVVIDFEYCSYNYRGFDIANHMCEWQYDYSNGEPPYYWASEENYPNPGQQKLFTESYLRAMREESQSNERSVNNEEIERLLYEVRAFTLASHFFWGLWSFCYGNISSIPFDYWGYGEMRIDSYFKQKGLLCEGCDSGFCRESS